MSTVARTQTTGGTRRLLTIGTVCRSLQDEFPDISISKIRYLEDQGLLTPRRTRSGYRLFGEEELERLRAILRMQRDEFLPLRVIRQELAAPGSADRTRRRPLALASEEEDELDLGELCERGGVTPELARELEEYGLISSRTVAGERRYAESDAQVALVCARLVRFGVGARHLRVFRNAADRQASLVEQLVAPALRARTPERRQSALEDLSALAGLAQELTQLLLVRDLRELAAR
jgi:DNA-binding transcriptional MerR regulator